MKFTDRHIIFIVIILITSLGYSQKDKLKEADKMFESYAFIDAQKIYLEVASNGYESENLFKKLGDSYYFNSDLEKAFEWYQKLYDINQSLPKEYLFRYAQSLKSIKLYEKSDEIMLEFDILNETDSRVSRLKKERNYLEFIEIQSGRFKLKKISINSDYSEFSPSFYGNKLVFASNRPNSRLIKRIHEWNNEPYLDLYSSDLSDSLVIKSEPILFSEELNSKFHESSAVFSTDGKTVYFTRNNFSDNKLMRGEDGISYLKLFKSELNSENTWTKPEELPFNNDNYSLAYPALSKDNKTLYFSSDMDGTIGMSDIFKVDIREDNTYSIPKNLGENINTEGRESFPFVSEDGFFYFASDGHLGLGGLDVFVAKIKDDGKLGEVFNLGRPINSTKDDFSFIINSKLKKGFFASNREQEGASDNIYELIQLKKLITDCFQLLNGNIFRINGEDPLSDVKVSLLDRDLKIVDSTITDFKGFYQFEVDCSSSYVVRISKDGFSSLDEVVEINSDFGTENSLDFSMNEGGELDIIKAGDGDDLNDLLQLDTIYFDLDKVQIRPDAEVELQKISAAMKSYPNLRIDVRSHTDSRARDEYNQILSNKRAKATINYIIEKSGVSTERISGRGYGESQLVNKCSNRIDCSESEHALNRRSEFIILKQNQSFEVNRSQQNELRTSKASFYDFENSSEELYTVQIAAFRRTESKGNFNQVKNVFSYVYDDGYKRYFSSVFKTKEEAKSYRALLIKYGIKDAFVIGLKGRTRF
jgi:outer membrane protein OmpA-like peptidoglycan-associated protein